MVLDAETLSLLLCLGTFGVLSEASSHRYKPDDAVPLYANKVGPFHNPRAFLCGGSNGLFIYGYCFYYYHTRSDMPGFMQTSFLFGYMACICYGFFLMLGAVGFRASLLFVRHIYRSIKCE